MLTATFSSPFEPAPDRVVLQDERITEISQHRVRLISQSMIAVIRLLTLASVAAVCFPSCNRDPGRIDPVPKACVALDFWFDASKSSGDLQQLSEVLTPFRQDLSPVGMRIPDQVYETRGKFMWVRWYRMPPNSGVSKAWLEAWTVRAQEAAQNNDVVASGFHLVRLVVSDEHQRTLHSWGALK